MANIVSSFRQVNAITQQIIDGVMWNGLLQGLTFASGETEKYLLIEVPADVTCQFVTQGLTMQPYDDTFSIRLLEDITTLTTGTPIIYRNMNRNFAAIPSVVFSEAPVGSYLGEGIILEDYTPFERKIDHKVASKTLKDNVERIFIPGKKYLFKFSRATDTQALVIEFRWLWIEG